jgi:hypothetical protein
MGFAILFHLNVANRGIVDDWDEKPVLVPQVYNVHRPNGEIPSIVRLYVAHEKIEKLGCGGVYLQLPQSNFKEIAGRKHRELGSIPITSGNEPLDGFKPHIIESALEIVDSIPDDYGQTIEGVSVLGACKVALDVFESSVRVHMGLNCQSFFQAIDAPLKVRNVMVGSFDLETGTFADRHSNNLPCV